MAINPVAFIFWGFAALLGYLIGGDSNSALIGLCIAMGVSLLATVF